MIEKTLHLIGVNSISATPSALPKFTWETVVPAPDVERRKPRGEQPRPKGHAERERAWMIKRAAHYALDSILMFL
jgi:hypothetical protein